jgi:hypothetical protein
MAIAVDREGPKSERRATKRADQPLPALASVCAIDIKAPGWPWLLCDRRDDCPAAGRGWRSLATPSMRMRTCTLFARFRKDCSAGAAPG